jgi:predicted enzyme related to lactoylglutathione lyase
MDFRLELIPVPVSDVERAKAFYEQAGFAVDNDVTVKEGLRIEAARDELSRRGLEVSEVQDFPWGRFVFFSDPDGNGWAVPQIPDYGEGRPQPEGR